MPDFERFGEVGLLEGKGRGHSRHAFTWEQKFNN